MINGIFIGFVVSDIFAGSKGSTGFSVGFVNWTVSAMVFGGLLGFALGLIMDLRVRNSARQKATVWLWVVLVVCLVLYFILRPAFQGIR